MPHSGDARREGTATVLGDQQVQTQLFVEEDGWAPAWGWGLWAGGVPADESREGSFLEEAAQAEDQAAGRGHQELQCPRPVTFPSSGTGLRGRPAEASRSF